ncbi:hypothetical protein PtB15_8B324 [Puccinia triticina]|nr:hypothetical protein PtB15_8B324 [Puccinia triticina]
MRTILQLLLLGTLVATAWVNAVLLKVAHKGNDYWIAHIDHKWNPRDGAPFKIGGEKRRPRGSNYLTVGKLVGNTSRTKHIQIGVSMESYDRGPILQAGHRNLYLFNYRDGLFFIATEAMEAEVNSKTWREIIGAHRQQLYELMAAEGVHDIEPPREVTVKLISDKP